MSSSSLVGLALLEPDAEANRNRADNNNHEDEEDKEKIVDLVGLRNDGRHRHSSSRATDGSIGVSSRHVRNQPDLLLRASMGRRGKNAFQRHCSGVLKSITSKTP